jgi:hypothetical protein
VEPLPELPVEEASDGAASASKAQPGNQTAQQTAQEAPARGDTESTQTLLKPEFLLADDEPTIPGAAEAASPEAAQVLEVDPDAPLTLDSALEVDKMLSAPPPAASPPSQGPSLRVAPDEEELTLLPDSGAPAKPTAAAPAAAAVPKPTSASTAPAAKSAAAAAPPATPALVPLARRASLTAAAQKLAAAAAAAPQTQPQDPARVAREQFERNAQSMAAVKIPMATEPPFHFKA